MHTVGVAFKASGLMRGKLALGGDLTYAQSKTPISVTGGLFTSNGTANVWPPAESLPDASTDVFDLRLNARYALNKNSAVRLSY